jgi:hypothetical protein
MDDWIFHTSSEFFYIETGVQRVIEDKTRNNDVFADSNSVSALWASFPVGTIFARTQCVKNEHKLKKYTVTSEHVSMVVLLALPYYFRAQELKVCFHRHTGISMVSVATTVGQTTVDKQGVRCKLNS